MLVALLLLLTAFVSCSVHVSSRGTWAVITLRESLGYVDITYVMSVSKSPLPFIIYYVFEATIENNILITCGLLHLYEQTGSILISVCAILDSTSPLH